MPKTRYRMSKSAMKWFFRRFGELRCYRCGGKILLGDKVLSNKSRYRGREMTPSKVYHEWCWESMFFE